MQTVQTPAQAEFGPHCRIRKGKCKSHAQKWCHPKTKVPWLQTFAGTPQRVPQLQEVVHPQAG
jgi:hypothetical protein